MGIVVIENQCSVVMKVQSRAEKRGAKNKTYNCKR